MSGTVEEKATRDLRICANQACLKSVVGRAKNAKYCSPACKLAIHLQRKAAQGDGEYRGGQGYKKLPARCLSCNEPTDWPRFSPDHDYTERRCGHCGYFIRVDEGLAAELEPIQ